MRIIRQSELTPAPWKNGGGVTREALRWPVAGEPWTWRLSFAQVDTSGPFSDFSGYARYLVLLRGDGVRLQFGDGSARVLREPGDLASFDGGIETRGELLAGPCVDLNLMIARASCRAEVRIATLRGPLREAAVPGVTLLVVPVDGSLELIDAAGQPARLEPWDIAVGASAELRPQAPCRVFIAAIADNSP